MCLKTAASSNAALAALVRSPPAPLGRELPRSVDNAALGSRSRFGGCAPALRLTQRCTRIEKRAVEQFVERQRETVEMAVLAHLKPWPPAEKGNERAEARRLRTRAAQAGGGASAGSSRVNPHLDPARNGPAVERYAVLLARIGHVNAWLASRADPVFANRRTGKAHAIYDRLTEWERTASNEEDRLAISPLTRARLGLDTARAFDLAQHWASEEDDDQHDDENDQQCSAADVHGSPSRQLASSSKSTDALSPRELGGPA